MRDLEAMMILADPADCEIGVCAAWIDSADRRCGRPAEQRLCARHIKTALTRLAKVAEKVAKRAEQDRQSAEARRVLAERLRRNLAAIEPRPLTDDAAVVNLPLAKRMPSDSRIAEIARLRRAIDLLERSA